MKMVTAIIRPAKLDDVIDALEVLGANKLTATEVRGIGRGTAARAQADDVSTIAPAEEIEIEVAVSERPAATSPGHTACCGTHG